MKNHVNCKCGNLHGTVEMAKVSLVLNSVRKKDNGLKFQLAYEIQGRFVVDQKNNLLRCVDCGGAALTSADWESTDRPEPLEVKVL